MKRSVISILAIIVFTTIGLFGFWGMHTENGHLSCIATATGQTPCPKEVNPLAFATFHLTVFKGFSQATLDSLAISIILMLLAPVSLILFGQGLSFNLKTTFSYPISKKLLPRRQPQIRRWLALREKRDPLFIV